ncbi:MAG: hypothetical protein JEZ03_01550 [Bacteroidales bacterium]|nr:hypothetical protein [Bacteroidales bacterium]
MKRITIYIIIGLFFSSSGFCQKKLEIIFFIKDWENRPVREALIEVSTDDEMENKKYGRKSAKGVIVGDKGRFKAKVLSSDFLNRSVTIKITGDRTFHYDKIAILENITLSKKQKFDINLEKDWKLYDSTTKGVYVPGNLLNKDSIQEYDSLRNYISKMFKVDVYIVDFENIDNDYAEFVINIDSTCTISNVQIVKSIANMKTDLISCYLDNLEKYLKEKVHECDSYEDVRVRINWAIK